MSRKLWGFNSSEKWRHNWGLWPLVYHGHRLQSYQIKNFIVRKILFLLWGIQPAQKKAPMVQYGIPLWNETVRFFWMIAICLSTIVFVILHELSLCLSRLCSHDSMGLPFDQGRLSKFHLVPMGFTRTTFRSDGIRRVKLWDDLIPMQIHGLNVVGNVRATFLSGAAAGNCWVCATQVFFFLCVDTKNLMNMLHFCQSHQWALMFTFEKLAVAVWGRIHSVQQN